MKRYTMLVALLALGSTLAWSAEDGAAIFKTKCAMCHGPNGEGKIGPSLKGVKLSAAEIANMLEKGVAGKKAPHSKPLSGLTAAQATAVAAHVKMLK